MAAHIERVRGNVYRVDVTRQLRQEDMERIQGIAEKAIGEIGKIRLLVVGSDFTGWARDADWGDVSFMSEHDEDIEKIAVVGNPGWRDQILMFLGAGLRAAPVEFFTTDQMDQANAWLER